jgi:hypothetical protein
MCWEWEEEIYRNWLKNRIQQEQKQDQMEEKEVEEISEVKEKQVRTEAPIYRYLKSDLDTKNESRRKSVKTH